MFGFARQTDIRQLRELFAQLQTRLDRLEAGAPAVSAAMLDAQDKLNRASSRWDKAMSRAAAARQDHDGDDPELDELLHKIRGR